MGVGYNQFGDMTSKPEDDGSTTTYAYDFGGKLTAIGRTGTADDASFTFDALGRFRTRVLASSTDTYSYLGTTEAVIRIDSTVANADIDSIITSAGDRLGIDGATTMNWLLPDPHGSVAASLAFDEGAVTNAIRYDPWGDTLVTASGGGSAVGADKWKYQGRLDLSPSGIGESLYDFSARFYAPSLGVFTQLDSVMGSAQNPLSMNRFMYAHANPTSLIDPSGHGVDCGIGMPCTDEERAREQQRAQDYQRRKTEAEKPAPPKPPGKMPTAKSVPRTAFALRTEYPQRSWLQVRFRFTERLLERDCFYGSVKACELKGGTARRMLGPSLCEQNPLGCAAGLVVGLVLAVGVLPAVTASAAGAAGSAAGAAASLGADAAAAWSTGGIGSVCALLCDKATRALAEATNPLPDFGPGLGAASHIDDAADFQRLAQDIAVNPTAPQVLRLDRPIGNSASQNALAQARIAELQALGARDIRVNQQQVNAAGQRVGINRPDLQYTLNGQRYYEEFDRLSSNRGFEHQARLIANDLKGLVNLFWAD